MARSRFRMFRFASGLVLAAVASAVGLLALELGARLVWSRVHQRPFVRAEVQARLLTDRTSGSPIERLAPELAERLEKIRTANLPDAGVVLHPYFGFVVNPDTAGINTYGFFADSPLVAAAPDTFTVALFGGSLTDQVFYMAHDALVAALQAQPALAGREVRVVSTALGGYKQPQQLNVLAHFLARGSAYDAVVNLDGFNEIDAPLENLAAGVNPYFPFNWSLHARRGLDPEATTTLGRIDLVRRRRAALRAAFGSAPWHTSAFALTFWDVLDRHLEAAQRAHVAVLAAQLGDSGRSSRVRGPAEDVADESALLVTLADYWARASRQMQALCDAHGVTYVHFLQPNQYVPDSKPFSAEELAHAVLDDAPIRDRVTAAYPLLVARGAALAAAGVRFEDLTMMFAAEQRSIYSDTCCHVNELGARLLAERIAATLGASLG